MSASKWLVEAGELKGLCRSDCAALKAYLARTHDEASPPARERIAARIQALTASGKDFVIIMTSGSTDYLAELQQDAGQYRPTRQDRQFWYIPAAAESGGDPSEAERDDRRDDREEME